MNNPVKVDPKKVLIIRLSSLGDIIHCLPVTYNLKKYYLKTHITWLVRERYKELLQMDTHLDEIIEIKETKANYLIGRIKEIFRVIRLIRKQHFDIVIDLHCVLISNFITFLSGSPLKLGVDKENDLGFRMYRYYPLPRNKKMHRIVMYLSILHLLGVKEHEIRYSFLIALETKNRIDAFFEQQNISKQDLVIAIHPGAGVEIKRWSEENFAKTSSELAIKYNAKAIIIYGPKQRYLIETIRKKCSAKGVIFAPSFNIKELAELLGRSDIFIGNDSGPLHLAAAMGVPTISIFGPSDPYSTGPYGNKHKIIRKTVDCSPCYKGFNIAFNCKNNTHKCMQLLSADEVLKEMDGIITRILIMKKG